MKQVSSNFLQSVTRENFQMFLPAIFQYYAFVSIEIIGYSNTKHLIIKQ